MLIAEQVFQVSVSVFLFAYAPSDLVDKLKIQSSLTYISGIIYIVFVSFVCFLVLPLIYGYLPFAKKEVLENSRFNTYFGECYSDINMDNKMSRYFLIFQYLRKILMVSMTFVVTFSVGNQIISYFYLNLISLVFVGYVEPYRDRFKNNVQLFNEACITMLGLSMVLDTDFCSNLETRYYSGYMYLALLMINIGVNIYLIFRKQIFFLILRVKWFWVRFKWFVSVIVEYIFPKHLRR